MKIGTNLKYLRDINSKTQKQVADALGISQVAYSRYETDKREPDFETLDKIANYYKIEVHQIFLKEISVKI